jgi:hypothetical protein
MTKAIPVPDEMTTAEAAQELHCSERTVRNMIKRGTLNARKLDPTAKSIYYVSRVEVFALAMGNSARGKKPTRRTKAA